MIATATKKWKASKKSDGALTLAGHAVVAALGKLKLHAKRTKRKLAKKGAAKKR